MSWDKVAVPFKVQVNVNDIVTASIHRQLYGLNQYYWEGWDDAAGYFLANKINLEEALKDEDQSIQAEERFDNLISKSKILETWGARKMPACTGARRWTRAARCSFIFMAASCRTKRSGRGICGFPFDGEEIPRLLDFAYGTGARVQRSGDFDNAVKEVKLSLASAPDSNKSNLENYVKRLQNKEDINR